MAGIVNPQDPGQDPNYLNYSKTIQQPAPDLSAKYAIDTATGALDTGISGVDLSIKEGIKSAAYKAIDPLRDDFTAGLEKIKGSLDQGVIPAPIQGIAGTKVSGTSLLDANASMDEEDLPTGLQSGLDRLTSLAEAKAAGSPRLNDTQYAKDTLSVAKNLRNTYGVGYRDYIDQEVSKISGLPVANSYYQNMLQDINLQLTQIGKTKDDTLTTAMKNLDVPGMTNAADPSKGFIEQYKAGKMPASQLLAIIGDHQAHEATLKTNALEAAEKDRNNVQDVQDGTKKLATDLNQEVLMRTSGIVQSGGLGSYKDYADYFSDVASGKQQQSETQIQQRAQQFNGFVTQFNARLSSIAASRSPLIGSKAAQDEVNNAMAPIYTLQKWVNDKDNGPTIFAMKQAQAIRDDADYKFLINRDWGQVVQQITGARKNLGDQYLPVFVDRYLQSSMDTKFKGILSQENMAAVSDYMDNRNQPVPRYMKQAVEHGKEIDAPPEYHGQVFQIPQSLADTKMPDAAKDHMIKWAYSDNNRGILEGLNKDYRDPRTGAWVPGQYHGFNLLASPSVVDGVAQNAKAHPENYKMFSNHLEEEFGGAFRSTLLDLNKLVEPRTVNVDESGRPVSPGAVNLDTKVTSKKVQDAHFSFNEANNNFGIVDNNNRPITRSNLSIKNPLYSYYSGMLDKLDLVNGGISRIAYVHQKDPTGPGDTPKYLLQLLQTAGFRPGENITNATEGMAKAIIKSKAPEMTPKDIDEQLLKFAPEANGQSFSQWVTNPANLREQPKFPKQPRGVNGNLSDERLLARRTDDIPEGMSARDFIKQLQSQR